MLPELRQMFYFAVNLNAMNASFRFLGSFSLLIIFNCSCAQLNSINRYSSLSAKSIQLFNGLGYSFQKHCEEVCLLTAIKTHDIERRLDCSCATYKKADSITFQIHQIIQGYFNGLAQLSEGSLSDYTLTQLNENLSTGNFASIKIAPKHVDAFSKISGLMLKASTDVYKKKKLNSFIAEANDPLQILLSKFEFILQNNLKVELDFQKEKLYSAFKPIILKADNTNFDKTQASYFYYKKLDEINRQQNRISAYARCLHQIASGHQWLFNHRHELKEKDVRRALMRYNQNIQDFSVDFITLN